MKKIQKMFFLGAILNVLAFVPTHAAEVVERGGGGGYRGGNDARYDNQGRYDNRYNNGGYYGEGGYYGTPGVVVPAYGGYLLPGEVNPGEDEADAIYRANQHPGE